MSDSRTLAQTLVQLASHKDADTQVSEFFNYLKKNNLLEMLPQIKRHVQRIGQQNDTYHTLVITSRYPLSTADITDIKQLTGADETTSVHTKLSEEVLGSFHAQYRGKRYDGSLQSAVNQMNNTLSTSL